MERQRPLVESKDYGLFFGVNGRPKVRRVIRPSSQYSNMHLVRREMEDGAMQISET